MDNNPQNLLFKYFSGSCTAEELSLIEEWIHRSPQNKEDFRKMERLWFSHGQSMDLDVDKAWLKVNEALQAAPLAVTHRKNPVSWTWVSGMAAAITLLVVGIYFFLAQQPMTELVAQEGVATYDLPDGSKVWLRENSRLKYRFDGDERALEMSGTVYFDVERDAERPFVVKLQKTQITVLGTSFLAQTSRQHDRVNVTEGSVAFNATEDDDLRVELTPGEEGTLELASGNLIRGTSSDDNLLAWQTGVLVFNKTPLRSVVQSLMEYYRVDITFETDEMGNCLITSRFNNQPIEEVLAVIEKLLSAELVRTEKGFLLKGQGC